MKKFVGLGVVLAVVLALFATVSAHEPRVVGTYNIALGWSHEPAYAGLYNQVEIFISQIDPNAATPTPGGDDDEAGGTPVVGAEETLKLEAGYGGKTKALNLYAADGSEGGHYFADIIPTQPGDYTFHLTGKIGDTDIDETFNSADGKFSSVDPITDIQFP
jgi:hypothetical protein